jgi:2-dehydropantoate 2-reductase
MRIGVVGAGGVGGYFGGRLAYAGADVAMVARGEHLNALQHHGLEVRHVDGDFSVQVAASADPSDIGRCDIVLLCVKSYDTVDAVKALRPLIGDETAVVSLQNGVDNEEKIAELLGADHVMGGAAFVFAHVAAPGVVEQTGGPRRILFGELDGSRTTRAELFLDELQRADIDATLVDNIESVLWDKYAFLCALAGVTAAARLPINAILEVAESRELFRRIVREVAMVASAEGVELDEDIVDQNTAFATTLEPGSFSSLHHDLSTGHRLELDALHGELLRRARRHHLDLPACSVVYALIKPWELANRQSATQPQLVHR